MVAFGFTSKNREVTKQQDEAIEKLQTLRVKFLRIANRLVQTTQHSDIASRVLYVLESAEWKIRNNVGPVEKSSNYDRATSIAEQLEKTDGQETPLDFTCTILLLGKSGVGKSSTINSLLDEGMANNDAFDSGTKKIQDFVGTVQGIKVRIIDTPGLLPSCLDQHTNEKILHSVKNFIRKTPPDVILYFDRLDVHSRDYIDDMPLLRTITKVFGASIWVNSVVVLTHATSIAPESGSDDTTMSYNEFVIKRGDIIREAICNAVGGMEIINYVYLVENRSTCHKSNTRKWVLPNGDIWKPQLLLMCFGMKIRTDATKLLNVQNILPKRRCLVHTLPVFLSYLLQSKPEVKLPSEIDGDAIDDNLEEDDSTEDYDELPDFKELTKTELANLSESQKKAYYNESDYREALFKKKLLKEKKMWRKLVTAELLREQVNQDPAEVTMPNSSDSDGINVNRLFILEDKTPISLSCSILKNKKEQNFQMNVSSSIKPGKGKATSVGFEMESIGNDMTYSLRGETRFSNHRVNKFAAGLTAGVSATFRDDTLAGGIRVDNNFSLGRLGDLAVTGGGVYGCGDAAYGGSLNATLVGLFSDIGVSFMHTLNGKSAIQCNSLTQIPVGQCTNLIGQFNIDNQCYGKISIGVQSLEKFHQIVLIGVIPFVVKFLVRNIICSIISRRE